MTFQTKYTFPYLLKIIKIHWFHHQSNLCSISWLIIKTCEESLTWRLITVGQNRIQNLRVVANLALICMCLVGLKMAPMITTEQRSIFGARMQIVWEEQLVDPPIDHTTPVNVP